MTINQQDILNSILESLDRIDYIKPKEIPNIDLYMDQVTTFMEEHLNASKRYPEDKILTKTMINNYAKNRLLPSPEKKKYSKAMSRERTKGTREVIMQTYEQLKLFCLEDMMSDI